MDFEKLPTKFAMLEIEESLADVKISMKKDLPFQFDLCQAGYSSKVELKKHKMKKHSDVKSTKCKECGQVLKQLKPLKVIFKRCI